MTLKYLDNTNQTVNYIGLFMFIVVLFCGYYIQTLKAIIGIETVPKSAESENPFVKNNVWDYFYP